jgi:hypothetical protein
MISIELDIEVGEEGTGVVDVITTVVGTVVTAVEVV